jgi:hypothetical protein
MSNSQLWTGTATFTQGSSTSFGFYDNDYQFQLDAVKVAKYCATRLGYPSMDVEMDSGSFFTCFESAVTTYGNELYLYQIRNNFLSLEANPNDISLNNKVITPSLGNTIRLAQDYGSEAGVGGNVTYYTGSIDLSAGKQNYDLKAWASSSGAISPDDSIEIKTIFYENAPAIVRYFDPYAGTGYGSQQLLDAFGFGNKSPAINFMLMPLNYDIGTIQAIELNDQIRRSAFSFQIVNNDLRIFPSPTHDKRLFFEFVKVSERDSVIATSGPGSGDNLITDISNVPYDNPTYSNINAPGRYWIFEYTLALAAETLGLIRGKYTQVPIPGAEVSLNQADLLSKAKELQVALIEKLRLDLDESSRKMQLERKAAENAAMTSTLQQIPMNIFIG